MEEKLRIVIAVFISVIITAVSVSLLFTAYTVPKTQEHINCEQREIIAYQRGWTVGACETLQEFSPSLYKKLETQNKTCEKTLKEYKLDESKLDKN